MRSRSIVVPADTPGLDVQPAYRKMGWHASDTHGLTFVECRVPKDHLLGEQGRGYAQFLEILDEGRVAIAALAVGVIQRCLDDAVAYAGERMTFGRPIGSNQGVAFRCADLHVALAAARHLTYHAAWLRDHGKPFKTAAAIAKLYATEAAIDATTGGDPGVRRLRVHGRDRRVSALPGRQDPRDRRGHERGAATRDRPHAGTPRVAESQRNCCKELLAKNSLQFYTAST